MSYLLKVMLALMAGYVALLGLVYVFQPRMVFFPTKGGVDITPLAAGLAFEKVRVPTEDGEQLAAWWIPGALPARGTVLLFHGNAGNIAHRVGYAKMFYDLGYNTLLVDYRGYGESSGEPTEEGTYRDARASWTWLTATRGIKPSSIVVFGESLGGGVAAWLAAQQSQPAPRALILSSTFTSIPDLGAELYPWLPVRWLSRIHYDNLANLERSRAPLLIAHSPGDEIIPYAHGRRLYAAARGPKAFLELGGGHNEGFVFAREAWVRAVQGFLERYEDGDRK
ncbi:MAG: alpha/beta hydrolase [Betaproteobacteria bacterium]|nr:alpha/beta hydrolase [Betaproteobacteria bacterium]